MKRPRPRQGDPTDPRRILREPEALAAIDQETAEVKYFLSNATEAPTRTILAVGFRRATVEHGFRLCKQEAGLTHFEGRQYAGLMRHLALSLVVMGFVPVRPDRLRGKKIGR